MLFRLLILFTFYFTGCSHHQTAHVVIQKNAVFTQQAQKKLVWDTCKMVYENQKYRYDSEIDEDGERWDSLMYKAILARAKNKTLPYAKGDCEDTMWANARILYQSGFPADQLYLTYCTVLADQEGNRGGHAILIVLIEGMTPQVVEQLPEPRPLSYVLQIGYKLIAFVRFDKNIKTDWHFFTGDQYELARTIFHRKDFK